MVNSIQCRNISHQNSLWNDIETKEKLRAIFKQRIFSLVEQRTKRFCLFGIFTSIAIFVAILTVSLTSPRPSKKCEFSFKRIRKSSIATSSKPRSIAVGDFNNDHYLDIAVANSGTNTIGIFFLHDNETFASQKTYSTGIGSRPSSLVTNDFNNDNYLDIAVANYGSNSIGIFLGNNNGTFSNQNVLSLDSSRPIFISIGDFNNDNKMDIAVANNSTDTIGILLGNGDGSFQKQIIYSTGYDSRPQSLAIGDFNNDNNLDVAVANYGTSNIGIFLGCGDGKFHSQNTYANTLHSNPSSIVVGDLNNDNHLDILVAHSSTGDIGIFFGYENGTFAKQTTFSISSHSYPEYITVGYFDKDKQLDAVVVDSHNNHIHVLLKYDNETFTKTATYDGVPGSHPSFVAVADFNYDNESDVAIANYGTNNVLILSKHVIKPLTRQKNYFIGKDSRSSSIFVYDFNNDDRFDLLVNNFNNDSLVLLIGNNNGTFTRETTYFTGHESAPKQLCVGDLNNDNRIDIITANYGSDSIGILLGQDRGTFSNVKTYSTGHGSKPWSVAVGDFNNDSRLDVVTANNGFGGLSILFGDSNETFTNVTICFTDIMRKPLSVVVGYVNNDMHLDIITAICSSDDIAVLLGQGDGTFATVQKYFLGDLSCPNGISLVDLNNDSYMDVIVSTLNGGFVGILFGYGDGTFSDVTLYLTGSTSSHYSIAVADFNHDHHYDFVVNNIANDEVIIFYGYGNGNFHRAKTYSIGFGSRPYAVTTVKLKNKNTTNIIVTLWGTGNLAVLTEYDAVYFANRKKYSTGSAPQPYSITIGNFRDNNHVDIAVVNSGHDTLDVLFNSGNSSFETQLTLSIGADHYPLYVTTGDINKDDHLDIVTINSKNNSISVILGHGNGSFETPKMYSTEDGSYPLAVAINDINGDNRSDLVIANTNRDNIGILFRYNYTLFKSENKYFSRNERRPLSILTSDFNNDTYLDIAVTFYYSHTIGILLGHGNGTFGIMMIHALKNGSKPESLVAHDFNNDGRLDIIVVNAGTDDLVILLGCGNGSFTTTKRLSTGENSNPIAIILADINKDGRTDIVVVNHAHDTIGVLFGYGNLTFSTLYSYSTGIDSGPKSIAAGDFNSDGRIDIVVGNYGTSSISIFLGNEKESFITQMNYSTGYQSWPACITVGDFNGDNQLDFAVSNHNLNDVGIFLGYGNGSFAPITTYSTGHGSSPRFLDTGDFNNDGKLDIAVANYGTNNIVVLFGYGDGTFLLGIAYRTGIGSSPCGLAIGDFNKDSILDIAVANYKSNDISIFLANGTDLYAGVTSHSMGDGAHPISIAIDDLNNDGLADIAVANYGTDNVGILLGSGHRNFDSVIPYSTGIGSGPYSLSIADFNNDYRLDIVVANSKTNTIAILTNIGNGMFVTNMLYSTGSGSQPYAVVTNDFNNDGISDIAVANAGTNNIVLFYGYGDGYFGNKIFYALGFRYQPYSIAVADLNQDGWLDIVIACHGTDHVEMLIKMC
ncbi:unnamed protein product [Rotaria socialis]|uniref:Uncharacterized protein n=1 Tax=Rotaria socialis TaxID=392032 RepID=A0A821CK87_9BILA|nr:unnamed protein product [Rotaria socialis]